MAQYHQATERETKSNVYKFVEVLLLGVTGCNNNPTAYFFWISEFSVPGAVVVVYCLHVQYVAASLYVRI